MLHCLEALEISKEAAIAEHSNIARIRDGYAAFSKGDFASLNDFFAVDILWHGGGRG
jgi:ketosteroid isomerase-like protein